MSKLEHRIIASDGPINELAACSRPEDVERAVDALLDGVEDIQDPRGRAVRLAVARLLDDGRWRSAGPENEGEPPSPRLLAANAR